MAIVINVTQNGARVFSTSRGSLQDADKAVTVAEMLRERFPESDGFGITMFEIKSEANELDPMTGMPPVQHPE